LIIIFILVFFHGPLMAFWGKKVDKKYSLKYHANIKEFPVLTLLRCVTCLLNYALHCVLWLTDILLILLLTGCLRN